MFGKERRSRRSESNEQHRGSAHLHCCHRSKVCLRWPLLITSAPTKHAKALQVVSEVNVAARTFKFLGVVLKGTIGTSCAWVEELQAAEHHTPERRFLLQSWPARP